MYFNPDDPYHRYDIMDVFGKLTALKIYGLLMQGTYGNTKAEAPSYFSLLARLQWNSWDNQRGKSRNEAQKEWIGIATKYFTDINNHLVVHPGKKIVDRAYADCV